MRIAICDDTRSDLHWITLCLEKYRLKHPALILHVSLFSHPDHFLGAYAQDPHYDLILLDMVMPFMSGLDVARTIRKSDESVKIVFMTISPDYAIEAYDVNAHHYLIKPVQENRLFKILDDINTWIKHTQNAHLIIRERESMIKLNITKIAYIEVMKHRLFYHLTDSSILTSYCSLKEVCSVLLKEPHFIKVHKSYLVNYFEVDSLSSQSFIMNDKTIIPISRTHYKPIRQHYLRFLIQHGKAQ